MSELVKAEEFGLEEGQVKEIELAFQPKIAERDLLTKLYEGLISVEMSKGTAEEAGDLRRKLVKVRTGISKIHKTQKAFFLASGRFVDAWKNKETEPVAQMEERLAEMEEYYINLEKERMDKLHVERHGLIKPYLDEDNVRNFGEMSDEDFLVYYERAKKKFDLLKEAEEKEKKAEEERILADKKKVQELAEKNKQILAEARKKEEADKKEIDRLKKEKEESDKVADDLKKGIEARAKQLEEEKEAAIVEEEAVALEKENRDDTVKWMDLINDLSELRGKYRFTDVKSQKKFENVGKLFTKIITYINS